MLVLVMAPEGWYVWFLRAGVGRPTELIHSGPLKIRAAGPKEWNVKAAIDNIILLMVFWVIVSDKATGTILHRRPCGSERDANNHRQALRDLFPTALLEIRPLQRGEWPD